MKEEVESNIYEDDFSFYNMNSIINFVKNNTIQIFLFLLVFIIIYLVDYITNMNTMILMMQDQKMAAHHAKEQKKQNKLNMKISKRSKK